MTLVATGFTLLTVPMTAGKVQPRPHGRGGSMRLVFRCCVVTAFAAAMAFGAPEHAFAQG
jgi:hypothetical protein